MKTFLPKNDKSTSKWYLIDAADAVLGKVAAAAAKHLAGKHRTDFTPHLDLGDGVIIINADKVHLSGQKAVQKVYRTHSGYRGGLKTIQAGTMLSKKPTKVIELAVTGMLPKNKLQAERLKRLKIYAAAEHNHLAQQPITIQL